jgi:menaquinol-cytochrome c reductase iron-sulfur subunit
MQSSNDPSGRRRFLSRVVTAIQAAIGGTLGVILGGAVISPGLVRRKETWLPAANLSNLPDNEPIPVVLRVTREDGYSQVVDRKTVFLIKSTDKVTAIDSTCTHLGCRVSWDAEAQVIKCPCHGGVYDRSGKVISGPPPMPLANFATRVDGDQVLVQV